MLVYVGISLDKNTFE